jgi:DNA-binding transcriptional ArsR family regulator
MSRTDAFAAIADPTRRSILETLRDRPAMSAGQIAANYPRVSRAAVSKHLGVLRRARLVRCRTRGRENHYSLEAQRFAEIQRWLESFAPIWEQSLANLKRQVEENPNEESRGESKLE